MHPVFWCHFIWRTVQAYSPIWYRYSISWRRKAAAYPSLRCMHVYIIWVTAMATQSSSVTTRRQCDYSGPRSFRRLDPSTYVWQNSDAGACMTVTSSRRHDDDRSWIMHADIQRCWLHAFQMPLMLIFSHTTVAPYVPGRLQWSRNLYIQHNAKRTIIVSCYDRPCGCMKAIMFCCCSFFVSNAVLRRRRTELNPILPHVRHWARCENECPKFWVPLP